MIIKSHRHWIEEIRKYTNEKNDKNIVKYALSYTLQSLRNGENMNKFKWK